MKIDKPGIYFDVAAEHYFADPAPEPSLTQSIAKVLIERSPAHARLEHPRLARPKIEDEPAEKYTAVTAIGNAAHKMMLGRGKEVAILRHDSFRSDKAKLERADAEAAGKIVILDKHWVRAHEMVMEARAQLDMAGHNIAFHEGQPEVVLIWQEGGVWLRTMIDWMAGPKCLYDYKTSSMSCAPHSVVDRPVEMGWDIQAAMHERALDALDPENAGRRQFYFIAQENEPPYALTPIVMSEADLTMGRKKLGYAIDVWRECMAAGEWPLYPAQTVTSRGRSFRETQWLEREVTESDRRPSKQQSGFTPDILAAG